MGQSMKHLILIILQACILLSTVMGQGRMDLGPDPEDVIRRYKREGNFDALAEVALRAREQRHQLMAVDAFRGADARATQRVLELLEKFNRLRMVSNTEIELDDAEMKQALMQVISANLGVPPPDGISRQAIVSFIEKARLLLTGRTPPIGPKAEAIPEPQANAAIKQEQSPKPVASSVVASGETSRKSSWPWPVWSLVGVIAVGLAWWALKKRR